MMAVESTLSAHFLHAQKHIYDRRKSPGVPPTIIKKIFKLSLPVLIVGGAATLVTGLVTGIAAYKGRTTWLRWMALPAAITLAAGILKYFAPHRAVYDRLLPPIGHADQFPKFEDLKVDSPLHAYASPNTEHLEKFIELRHGSKTDVEAAARIGLIFDIILCVNAAKQGKTKAIKALWLPAANFTGTLEKSVSEFCKVFNAASASQNAAKMQSWNLPDVASLDMYLKECHDL